MSFRMWIAAAILTAAVSPAQAARRALLVGINDYSASRLPAAANAVRPHEVPDLDGAVNDVVMMRDLLVALYGFSHSDVTVLTDQQASRDAILRALDTRLVAPTQKGDTVVFYFSGHGSQVRNSLSKEADRLDESVLPADSRRGARDIRDKELLAIFTRILDRGARLTVILDTCHSGSGARGLDGGLRHRGVEPDLRDVADPFDAPAPESRGALVLTAAHDFDLAFEMRDEHGNIRGAFSWALARAMRDADCGESTRETFLRAQARLHAERPAQEPVLAGDDTALHAPLFGLRTDRREQRAIIAVQRATGPATYRLEGGWASGITVGSELRLPHRPEVRLQVRELLGVGHAVAELTAGNARLLPGTLLEIETWAAPPTPPLRLWAPRAPNALTAAAEMLRGEAERRGICWIDDPTVTTPAHLLRWRGEWELVTQGRSSRVGTGAPLGSVPSGSSLFVQLPVTEDVFRSLRGINGVDLVPDPENADYILAGRLRRGRIEYACVRPFVTEAERARSVLPVRTAWTAAAQSAALRELVVRLRIVHSWQDLRSPAGSSWPYALAVRGEGDGMLMEDGPLIGNEHYKLVLRRRPLPDSHPVYARYLYVFVVASDGSSTLLFPPPPLGSVENVLPVTQEPGRPIENPPDEIALTKAPFVVGKPYGIDTYFLLSTDEPLPSLDGLKWRGVRAPNDRRTSALEELLAEVRTGKRSASDSIRTPANWTIDKVTFEAVPPRRSER